MDAGDFSFKTGKEARVTSLGTPSQQEPFRRELRDSGYGVFQAFSVVGVFRFLARLGFVLVDIEMRGWLRLKSNQTELRRFQEACRRLSDTSFHTQRVL